jgi:hypothetical protein
MNIKNKKGAALIVTYMVIAVLLVLGAAFAVRSISESRIAERHKKATQAFAIAEAGLELALYRLRMDFENGGANPSWLTDNDIDGIPIVPSTAAYYQLFAATPLGDDLYTGNYNVDLMNVAGEDQEIWVRATGVVGDITKAIEAYVKIKDMSPWNNAIFAGTGASGTTINGNVDIRGSVHILGNGLTDADFAMEMIGDGSVGNYYDSMPAELLNRVPPCPTRMFNGEIVESLDSEVRVKRGKVALSGSAQVGFADISGNAAKETVNGVYITDGYAGSQGANNVYSDNGKFNPYDLGDSVELLSLSDPYETYATYQDYLKDNALVISDPAELAELASITPNSVFNFADADGSISMDGAGNLTISGIVYVEGGDVKMSKAGAAKIITYTGKGSICTTENVEIGCNLYTQGVASYPANILGVMTPNQISFTTADLDVMGIFFAEDKITSTMQTRVAGTFVSNYFEMGLQVPKIYQIPSIIDSLPPGMIDSEPVWVNSIVLWRKIQ